MALFMDNSGAVVIVGGGFGGLTTALVLSRKYPRPPIILIEPRQRFVFLPLLYELFSRELNLWEVAPQYKSFLNQKGIVLIEEFVVKVDISNYRVITSSGLNIDFAQLVLSTGSESQDYGVPGVKEYAYLFQKLEDVEPLRQKIQDFNCSASSEKNFVIVGAGPTGIELACKFYDLLDNNVQVHLIELGDCILPQGTSFNQEQAEMALNKRNIRIHLNTRVVCIQEDNVQLHQLKDEESQSSFLSHNGLVWAAGSKPVIPDFDREILLKGSKLPVNDCLQVIGLKDVFALGDIANSESIQYSSNAQVAMQQGELVANNLLASRANKKLKAFKFYDLGEMLSLGLGEATITGLGFTLSGPLAFKIRRMTYLTRLPDIALGIKAAGSWLLGN